MTRLPDGTKVRVDPQMGLDWTPSALHKDAGRVGTVVRRVGPIVIVSLDERARQFHEYYLEPLSAVDLLGGLA